MRNLASLPFYFVLLVFMLLSFASCGFVHRVFDKKKTAQKEVIKQTTDSLAIKKTDSTAVKKTDSTSVKKKEEKNNTDVEIEFQDSTDNDVVITTDSSGKVTIKAKGKIKSVKTRSTNTKQSSDSNHVVKVDSATKKTSDSTALIKKTDITRQTKETLIHRDKKAFQPPWYAYLVLAIVAIALYFLYRKRIFLWLAGRRRTDSS